MHIPVCPVVVVLELVPELLGFVGSAGHAFEPLALVCLVSLVCEPFALVSAPVCLPVPFGLLVLSIGIVAILGCVCVAVLAPVFVGIGFGGGLGLSRTWYDRTCGCVLFCLGYVVVVVGIRVTALAVASHAGRVGFSCGIPEVLSVCLSRMSVINRILMKICEINLIIRGLVDFRQPRCVDSCRGQWGTGNPFAFSQ